MRIARHGHLMGRRIVFARQSLLIRHYSPMTKEEEEAEKQRVSKLSDYQKEMELRDLDRQIAKLNMLRGINNGELYTMR
jgi:hypothetical protein